jgi:RNase P/RNase MRP subunit POP5
MRVTDVNDPRHACSSEADKPASMVVMSVPIVQPSIMRSLAAVAAMRHTSRMADNAVRLTVIRVSGVRRAKRKLAQAMREEGVQLDSATSEKHQELLGAVSALLGGGADVYVVTQGTAGAVKAALAKFRESRPGTKVEAWHVNGTRLDGYL